MSIIITLVNIYLIIGCLITIINLFSYYQNPEHRKEMDDRTEADGLDKSMTLVIILACIILWGLIFFKTDKIE